MLIILDFLIKKTPAFPLVSIPLDFLGKNCPMSVTGEAAPATVVPCRKFVLFSFT